jgi:excisionase family DNA binding protein
MGSQSEGVAEMSHLQNQDWKPAEPLLLSIEQTSALLGISQGTVKNLLRRGELVRRKIGSRTLIPRSSVQSFLKKDHQTQGGTSDEQSE